LLAAALLLLLPPIAMLACCCKCCGIVEAVLELGEVLLVLLGSIRVQLKVD